MTAYKTAGYVPVSDELMRDALSSPFFALFRPPGEVAATFLRYGESQETGRYRTPGLLLGPGFLPPLPRWNPAVVAEDLEHRYAWWDDGWPFYLTDWDEEAG